MGTLLSVLFFNFALANGLCESPSTENIFKIARDIKSASKIAGSTQTDKFSANPIAYYDGPNCFNASLVGKGYLSELTHTDVGEFTFFVEKFCQKKSTPETPGDILAIAYKNTYVHAALAVNDGKIFEKTSTWGRTSMISPDHDGRSPEAKESEARDRLVSSQYLIKSKNDSGYFNGQETKGINTSVSVYQCKDKSAVQKDLNALSSNPEIQSIVQLNKKIEKIVFKKEGDPRWRENLSVEISEIAQQISASSLKGDEGLFLLTKAWSLSGQIWHLNRWTERSSPKIFNEAMEKLSLAIKFQERKMASKNAPLFQRVFSAKYSN